MIISSGFYRKVKITISVNTMGMSPRHVLNLDYSKLSSVPKKNFKNNKLVAELFNIDSKCAEGSKEFYPKVYWINMDDALSIMSTSLGADFSLYEYLSAIFKSIDAVFDYRKNLE